jgi:soluble lytic murein transglycosylase-like protein
MSPSAILIAGARAAAASFNLPAELVCAVCEHESQWDTYAVRYEPGFERKYDPVDSSKHPTEHTLRACSFGLMQIMGETARELGFVNEYLTKLCDPFWGLHVGCAKLAKCVAAHPGDTRAALLEYNGGANAEYPDLVLPLIAHYAAGGGA